jgi:hypothetical protein
MAAEVSTRYPTSISDHVRSAIQKQTESLAETIIAEVAAIYQDGLAKQVALLHAENQQLRARLQAAEEKAG